MRHWNTKARVSSWQWISILVAVDSVFVFSTYPSQAHSRRRCLPHNDRRVALGDGDVRAALRVAVGEMERASAAGRIVGEVCIQGK